MCIRDRGPGLGICDRRAGGHSAVRVVPNACGLHVFRLSTYAVSRDGVQRGAPTGPTVSARCPSRCPIEMSAQVSAVQQRLSGGLGRGPHRARTPLRARPRTRTGPLWTACTTVGSRTVCTTAMSHNRDRATRTTSPIEPRQLQLDRDPSHQFTIIHTSRHTSRRRTRHRPRTAYTAIATIDYQFRPAVRLPAARQWSRHSSRRRPGQPGRIPTNRFASWRNAAWCTTPQARS